MLKTKGYVNGHFGKWHMGPLGYYPEDMGFDINVGGNESGGPEVISQHTVQMNKNLKTDLEEDYLTDRLHEVVKFIEKTKTIKFFAYASFFLYTHLFKPNQNMKVNTNSSVMIFITELIMPV